MTNFRFLMSGALAGALVLTAMPAAAQDEEPGARSERKDIARSWGDQREPRAERAQRASEPGERFELPTPRAQADAAPAQTMPARTYGADRATGDAPPRDRSYGADTRGRDWAAQRQARDAAVQQQRGADWAGGAARRDDANRTEHRRDDWQRDRAEADRRADWQRDRRHDARRDEWQGDRRTDTHGTRDGRHTDNRYRQDHRRWDNHGWRNDNRYDWYRHRAANRSLYNIGRYYAPHRGYSYSRINIGFRLGSQLYSNRYWINDPFRYRLPDVYGPYRWVRYYDDALLVDVYSGEVVDVIRNFFW